MIILRGILGNLQESRLASHFEWGFPQKPRTVYSDVWRQVFGFLRDQLRVYTP